jgi:hypothetical protein
MVVTGFVMWFEEDLADSIMPLWLWEVCQVVHRFEAILAFLAIVVWHFYYVFANPDESPLALTWHDRPHDACMSWRSRILPSMREGDGAAKTAAAEGCVGGGRERPGCRVSERRAGKAGRCARR